MKIVIETIPHKDQRYPTAGDYWDEDGVKHIHVSALGDSRMELLVAIHELIESALCDARGIAEPDVKAFDEAHPESDDPGALADAPYFREHIFAEMIEKVIALELGVNWARYGDRIKVLFL